MAMSRNRMMSEVAEADVLLVNPTHVAVALKYDAAKGAPRVVAKGAGEVAAKLREIADGGRRAAGPGHPAGPGAARLLRASARRCRRSCSPRSPGCWPSSCTWARAA